MRCLKDRFTGASAGKTMGLKYDRATGNKVECLLMTDEPENIEEWNEGDF